MCCLLMVDFLRRDSLQARAIMNNLSTIAGWNASRRRRLESFANLNYHSRRHRLPLYRLRQTF